MAAHNLHSSVWDHGNSWEIAQNGCSQSMVGLIPVVNHQHQADRQTELGLLMLDSYTLSEPFLMAFVQYLEKFL